MTTSKTESKPSTTSKTKTRPCSIDGHELPVGTKAEGCIVTLWDENIAPLGQHGVITGVHYVENTTHEPYYTGNMYHIVKCTEDGTINGGLVMMTDRNWMRWTGKMFYDVDIPFDDDIPF